MYSHSARTPWFKSIIIALMIFAMVFTATPRQSEGIILLIATFSAAAPLSIGTAFAIIAADIAIVCLLGGLGCPPNNSGTPGGTCVATYGNYCPGVDPRCSTDTVPGTISCDGSSCDVDSTLYPPITCPSLSNMCGQTNAGIQSCGGICSATAPPDSNCSGITLDDPGSLIITPELVRIGDEITINWDLKTNYPPNCNITGPMQPANVVSNTSNGTFSAGNTVFTFSGNPGAVPYDDSTGTMVIKVTGPHQYTVSCGGTTVQKEVQVLPVIFES